MVLHFHIDQRSGYPVYLQIVEQVRRAVALGALSPGDQLPSVKQLAHELVVNPATISRALRELEHLQIVETQPGRGAFVRGNGTVAAARATAESDIRAALEGVVREAQSLGVQQTHLRELFESALASLYRIDSEANA